MSGVVNNFNFVRNIYTYILLALALLLFILFPVYIKEDSASAVTGTATASSTSLTIASGKNTASVAITPTNASGAFAASSSANKAEFNVSTNNYTGYTLAITAGDDTGNLVNTTTSDTIASITTNLTESSFNTSANNNKWGFKPNKYVSNNTVITNTGDGSVYLPSPTTTPTLLDKTNVANSTANNYTIALGIRADHNTTAGTYSKTFTLVATANPTTYTINYNQNTADTVTNMPTAQSSATSETSITLASNTPERDGYNFLGWCTVQTVDSSCSGTTYQPGDTYGLDQTTANTVTLYAMWQTSMLTMQGITLDTCPIEPMEVVDLRDGEVYTIQKLADGNCWLLDNLRLDLTNATVKNNLTPSTTNASNTTLNYLKNGGGTTSDQYAITGVVEWTSSPNYASSYSYSDPLIATSGTGNLGDWTKDTTLEFAMSDTGKIGVYYNFCAASAGSYCYGNDTSYGSPSGNATEDICPKGWRMPTGGSSGEYKALYAAYSSNATNFKNALRTPLSGYFDNGSAYNQGSYGYFWSSTYFDSNTMYDLRVGSSVVYPQDGNVRSYGFSVRCVLQASDISQISTMQDFENNNVTAIENSMTTGQAYTLTDSRDGETYSVAKLADGNVWLLDNLRLDLTNATVKSNLKASTTNASDATLNYLKNGGGTTSDKYATAGVANWTSSRSYSAPRINTASKDTTQPFGMSQSGTGKIGIYYNYCAASAGSYCYGNGTSYGSPSGNATEDICPKGWRMPTGGSSGEYRALYTAYSSDKAAFVNALRAPLSGGFSDGSAYGQGSAGYFWSSTYVGSNYMYSLYVGSSNVRPQDSSNRCYGLSVRCVLQ